MTASTFLLIVDNSVVFVYKERTVRRALGL